MNIVKKQDGSELLFIIEGSIDSTTAPDFFNAIISSLDGIAKLVLDFEKVKYISSAGLRVLLVAFKTMSKQGSMVIRKPNSNILDTFSMTGFDEMLTIEK